VYAEVTRGDTRQLHFSTARHSDQDHGFERSNEEIRWYYYVINNTWNTLINV